MIRILNSKIAKWFFHRYFGIPKDKEIFKLQKTAIHYWEKKSKGIAKCRQYQKPIWDLSIIKRLRYIGLIGLLFLKNSIVFIFPLLTDTASTNNKDSYLDQWNGGDVNYGNAVKLEVGNDGTNKTTRAVIHFTLSAGNGTISDVKLYVYISESVDTQVLNIHELSREDWVEMEVTWNIYKAGNAWTLVGGDYDGTVIDSFTFANKEEAWKNWVLMGIGATNPLVLDWEDNVHLLAKSNNEGQARYTFLNSKENVANKPYLEITYTLGGGSFGQII